MGNISFIHCGDLHLGCQQFNNAQRWDDFRDAFAGIIDHAIENRVNYMLISGDLFHHRNVNAQTLSMAIGELARLRNAGIEVIAIEGNHDKALYLDEDSWMSFLNQLGYLKLLKPVFKEGKLAITPFDGNTGCLLEMPDIRIIGLGYLGATTRQRLEEAAGQLAGGGSRGGESEEGQDEAASAQLGINDDKFTVVMLHAAVDKLLGQDLAGVSHDSFEAFIGMVDYFALGHVHSRQEYKDFIFNPGAPESVHIDEVRKNQEKGFYHVQVENGIKNVRFIPSVRRHICYFDIDISGIATPSLVMDWVLKEIDRAGINTFKLPLVQVNLYGSLSFNSFAIDSGGLADTIKIRYSCLAVEVLNNTNLVRISENGDMSGFDRSSVERYVISRMIGEERPEYSGFADELTDLVIKVKNYSLSNTGEDEIISAIWQTLGTISQDEATVAGNDGLHLSEECPGVAATEVEVDSDENKAD